jgi:nonspecific dipeptidase
MSDNYWLGKHKPCITYGLRGLCYFFCEVEMGSKDLHSGVFGGTVREALPDLIWLLDQLVDSTGTIQIPGMLDDVCPLLPEEEQIYKNIEFDLEDFKTDAGLLELRFPGNKVQDTFHFIVKVKLFYKHFLLLH